MRLGDALVGSGDLKPLETQAVTAPLEPPLD